MKFMRKFFKNFDTKKKVLFGIFLLLLMYILIFLNQPVAALILVFAFFLTLGVSKN